MHSTPLSVTSLHAWRFIDWPQMKENKRREEEKKEEE
jgi:hypothetical protein